MMLMMMVTMLMLMMMILMVIIRMVMTMTIRMTMVVVMVTMMGMIMMTMAMMAMMMVFSHYLISRKSNPWPQNRLKQRPHEEKKYKAIPKPQYQYATENGTTDSPYHLQTKYSIRGVTRITEG